MSTNKFYAYAKECLDGSTEYNVAFDKCRQTPRITIELEGDLANDFDLLELLNWLQEHKLFTQADANEVAELKEQSYYDEDEAILEALNGNAAYEAGLLDKIKQAISKKIVEPMQQRSAKGRIGGSEKSATDAGLVDVYKKNEKSFKAEMTDGVKLTSKPVMSEEQAVRYFIQLFAQNNDATFFALTQDDLINTYSPIHTGADSISDNDKQRLANYYSKTDHTDDETAAFKQSQSILARIIFKNIEAAKKGNLEIRGYTTSEDEARDWKSHKPNDIKSLTDDEAKERWDSLTDAQKIKFLSSKMPDIQGEARVILQTYIIRYGNPFQENTRAGVVYKLILSYEGPMCKDAASAISKVDWLVPFLAKTTVVGLDLKENIKQLNIISAIRKVQQELKVDYTKHFFKEGNKDLGWLSLEDCLKVRSSQADEDKERVGEELLNLEQATEKISDVTRESTRQQFRDGGAAGSIFDTASERGKFLNRQLPLLIGLPADQAVAAMNNMLKRQGFSILTEDETNAVRSGVTSK